MFSATDSVLQVLNEALDRQDPSNTDRCFRLVPGKDGLHLALDMPTPQDVTFSIDGQTVLALPESIKSDCADRTLDIDATGDLILR